MLLRKVKSGIRWASDPILLPGCVHFIVSCIRMEKQHVFRDDLFGGVDADARVGILCRKICRNSLIN